MIMLSGFVGNLYCGHLVLDTNILRNEGTNKYFHVGTGSPLITRSTREMSCPLIPQNILKEASIVSLISF